MIPVIHVERDTVGIQQAVLGLFEEAFQRGAIDSTSLMADVESRARALDDLEARKLSPGYYVRAQYLLGLAYTIEIGVQVSSAVLSHSDVLGLQAVKRAKTDFEREHPACGNCGVRQDNKFAQQCKGCHVKFLRGDD